jgi:hypothetical protein
MLVATILRPPPYCTALQPNCRWPVRAVASHQEGERRYTPPRSKEGGTLPACGVRLALRDGTQWHPHASALSSLTSAFDWQTFVRTTPNSASTFWSSASEWVAMAAQDTVDA